MGRRIVSLVVTVIIANSIFSQAVQLPNHGLKYPETLEVTKVETSATGTVIYLTVENRIEGGNFCADRNISITDPSGTKTKLRKASGIPVCPDTYKFRGIGEKLSFKLEFPPLAAGTKWIDLVEECSNNCFWIYGITLDDDLNRKLDEAFVSASKGKPADNVALFKGILDQVDNENLGIEGMLYINIINASAENADRGGVSVWYKRLTASNAPRVSSYIKYLNGRGIK